MFLLSPDLLELFLTLLILQIVDSGQHFFEHLDFFQMELILRLFDKSELLEHL